MSYICNVSFFLSPQGSPIIVEEPKVDDKGCWVVFEFVTNEACKIAAKEVEIPCTIYLDDGLRRDLTPLIKLKGTCSMHINSQTFVSKWPSC